jgi:hypothetical protein
LGKATRLCDGITRREVLRIGGLGALSFWGNSAFDLTATAGTGPQHFGQARSVVFVCLYGGPPHTETFDMKPNGPPEARGSFRPIGTNIPGVQICEHLPLLSKVADRYTLVRSFTHDDAGHVTALYTHLTGWRHPKARKDPGSGASSTDYPHYGSVMGYLRPPRKPVHPCMIVGGRILPQFAGIGQTGGFLGTGHAPYVVPQGEAIINHYGTLLSAGHGTSFTLPPDVPALRLGGRRSLLEQLNRQNRHLEQQSKVMEFSQLQDRAFAMLSSPDLAAALDLEQEPSVVRETYGRHFLGENLLLARRLVEAGVPCIQVSDIPQGREQHWDLHYANMFDRLKDRLLPRLDQSLSAFLLDLEQSGLLDQTLVIVGGEFGRTPWMDKTDGGRQHWPHCYSMLLAGGGIPGGRVFGSSSRDAAYPLSNAMSPSNWGATLLHLAGFSPDAEVFDKLQNRRRRICEGTVVRELF